MTTPATTAVSPHGRAPQRLATMKNRTMTKTAPNPSSSATTRPSLFVLASLPAVALVAATLAMVPNHAHAEEHGAADGDRVMYVVKTPTCGCCAAWVELARREGYEVKVTDTEDYAGMKAEAAVPEPMWSCHTTKIGGYTIEGHVPFAAVAKLMEQKPDIEGLAVPGMPMGSPGMGDDPDARFDVMAYGGAAKPNEVFFRAGIEGAESRKQAPGFFDRLFGRG